MSGKATVISPANIAFIKYWGAVDFDRAIPTNPSISMTLDACHSRCTAEHLDESGDDEVHLAQPDGSLTDAPESFVRGVSNHLDRIREHTGRSGRFRIATANSFPMGAGIASSASGFSALAIAATRALGLEPGADELSELARMSGSGSASRSVSGGYLEWPAEGSGDRCHAKVIASADHWDLRDVVVLADRSEKKVSSREGHRRAASSPHFARRRELLPARLDATRRAIAERDFERLAPVLEEEAIELHLIAMSSQPAIFYWKPPTLAILETVRELREAGCPAAATMDAGPNVHVICPAEAEEQVYQAVSQVPGIAGVIRDGVGRGPRFTDEHLA